MNVNLQTVSNYEKICRICLIIKTELVCVNYETNHMIESCFNSIQLYPHDKYPQQICNDCLIQLKNVCQFKEQFESSLNLLNKIITETNRSSADELENENSIQQYEVKVEVEEVEEEDLDRTIKQEVANEELTNQNIELDEININDGWIKLEEFDNDKISNNFQQIKTKTVDNETNNVIIKQHKISDFICNICKSRFISRSRLIKHVKTHILFQSNVFLDADKQLQGKFKCDNCLNKYFTLSELISHCEQDHEAKPIKCKQCNLECVNYLQMLKHEQSHSRKYVCEHCGIIFNQLSILESHKISSHSDKKDHVYVCSICDKSYPTISTLKSHVKTTHATRLESWDVCIICRKLVKCIKIHYLEFHGRIKNCNNKSSIKVHSCWCCDAKFGSWYALKRHMLKHGVERPFVCKICEKGFRFDTILEIHIRTQHCN